MKFTKYAVYLTAFLLMASASPLVQKSAVIRPITAAAEEASDVIAKGTLNESISWQLDSDYTLTITGSGDMSGITNGFSSYAKKIKKVIIRNTDSTHTITAVGSNLFSGCTALEEITLPDTITEIGSNAFRGCSKLSVCNFPSGLKKIRTRAFEGTALTELDLPGCELDERSFFYCTSLKTLTIGDGTEVIPEECFRECTSLESVYFSDSVKEIKSGGYDSNGSFYKCSSLKKVSIGKNIEKIHNYAFRTLGEGLEVTFREGVTAIPSKAFEERTELTKVVLPESLTTVNNNAFRGCSNLSVCNFPSGITKIGSRAFERTAFTELDLPGCELDERSFFYCTSLKTLTIGDGTEVIPEECFRECTSLESVYFSDSVKEIKSGGYDSNGSFYRCSSLKKVSIGKYIEKIHNYAFRTLGEGLEVTFREGVTAIPSKAFEERTELTKVILPESLTTVNNNAFRKCSNLSDCNFPSGLKKIGTKAFEGTAFTELDLPGCELDERSFYICTSLKTLTIGDGTEVIPAECFGNCTSLESVFFSDSVKEISSGSFDSNGSFYRCSSLKKVSIGKNIEKIHNYAFRTLGEGLEVTFREGVTAIPSKAFDERTELTKVVLPESLKTIGSNAFRKCSSLSLICIQSTDCEIVDSETTISASAVIRGYENSTAQEYAKKYERIFETFNEDDPVISYGNQVTGASLTLDGKIGVNFYATLSSKATKVVLTGPDGKVEYSGDKLAASKQSDGVYRFTYRVNPIQTGEQITIKFFDSKGRQLDIYNSSFEKCSDKMLKYSVNEYIADVAKYKNDAKLNAMVTALDNYCKASENYFLNGTHTLNITNADIKKTNDFKKQFEISLVLNTGTALRIYSNAANAVIVNGANELPLTATAVDKNTKYFEISDINAFSLLDNITVKLDSTTFKICPMDYCALVLAKSTDQKLKDVCNALYYYAAAAKEYGSSIQN